MIYSTLYNRAVSNESLRKLTKGQIFSELGRENILPPWLQISNVSCNLVSLDTCGIRYEEFDFQFNSLTKSYEETNEIFKILFSLYEGYIDSRIENIIWGNSDFDESMSGLWTGLNYLNIAYARPIIVSEETTVGNNIKELCFNRYKEYPELSKLVNYQNRIGNFDSKFPYACLTRHTFIENWRNTQQIIHDNGLTFNIYARNLEQLEEIVTAWYSVYDYSKLQILEEPVFIIEWQSTRINEIDPGIWQAELTYNITGNTNATSI